MMDPILPIVSIFGYEAILWALWRSRYMLDGMDLALLERGCDTS